MSTRRRMRSDNRRNAGGIGMKTVVIRNIDRADAAAIKRLGALGTATVHEAYGRAGLMKPYLRPVWAGGEAAGAPLPPAGAPPPPPITPLPRPPLPPPATPPR